MHNLRNWWDMYSLWTGEQRELGYRTREERPPQRTCTQERLWLSSLWFPLLHAMAPWGVETLHRILILIPIKLITMAICYLVFLWTWPKEVVSRKCTFCAEHKWSIIDECRSKKKKKKERTKKKSPPEQNK